MDTNLTGRIGHARRLGSVQAAPGMLPVLLLLLLAEPQPPDQPQPRRPSAAVLLACLQGRCWVHVPPSPACSTSPAAARYF